MFKFNKIIFLTGHRKSGTSLLHRLFDDHPHINLYPDDFTFFYSYFPYYTDKYKNNKKELINRIVKIYSNLIKFKKYNNNYNSLNIAKSIRCLKKSLLNINLLSKYEVFNTIISEWSKLNKKISNGPLIVKETSQSIFFHEFKNFFPKFKMVNIIRDPRDNFASIKSGLKKYYEKFGEDNISSLTSTIFRARQDLISAKLNEKNKSFTNIKYEDLTLKPKETMRKLCRFLDIEFTNNLINPTIFGEPYLGNNFNKKIYNIDKSNVKNWSKRISKEECCVIEYFLHDAMNIWGYKLKYKLDESEKYYSKFYEKLNSKYFFKNTY
ncbi:sulfotransferase family protein [Candidatus Pelagibacter sp. HIMB1695]|uniref:sulfotransferase family protein n=1 Tax=Candidatus Pelagibacter sp. HIMB1695 TaxID=3413364 RepID=UPI003F837B42